MSCRSLDFVKLRWALSPVLDAVDPELHIKVRSPDLRPGDNVREVMLEREDAEAALKYLERYEYASLPHVTLALLWHTMMRMGAAHALDVYDFSPEDKCVAVVHRPDQGTPIKNGVRGERLVGLSGQICIHLDDWLRDRRPDVTDEYGRVPLLATSQGSVSKSAIRSYSYRYTQPCRYGVECPHGRDPDGCEASHVDHLSKCPSSVSPHAIRREASPTI